MAETLVEVRQLTKSYDPPRAVGHLTGQVSALLNLRSEEVSSTPTMGQVLAVDNLSLSIAAGEVVGLVGESGSGKSTVGGCILHLITPTSGDILYEGQSILPLRGKALKGFRRKAQMVFQDPTASLDPRFTVERTLAEPLHVHGIATGAARRKRIAELLDAVHLRPDHGHRYPHELSGGERQRVVIARALATNPAFLVLDEPTSALDASAQMHILTLLQELKTRFNMTYLLISHDLSVVRHLCQRVYVMYLGRAIEIGQTDTLIDRPRHPYTQALMSAIPIPDPDFQGARLRLRGDLPTDATSVVDRCPLSDRCFRAVEECRHRPQRLVMVEPDRWVACHRVSEGEIS
jgi:oligopeptide transport system ATP-binding protein